MSLSQKSLYVEGVTSIAQTFDVNFNKIEIIAPILDDEASDPSIYKNEIFETNGFYYKGGIGEDSKGDTLELSYEQVVDLTVIFYNPIISPLIAPKVDVIITPTLGDPFKVKVEIIKDTPDGSVYVLHGCIIPSNKIA